MQIEKKWYAVYTYPRWEKKVAGLFASQNVEHYCPLQRCVRTWADRKKIVHEPFFTSYVFVRISSKEDLLVRRTDGVLNYVNWLGKPAVIQDKEMETLQAFLNTYDHQYIERIQLQVNDTIQVVHGALGCREGKVVAVLNHEVKVVLPSLGYAFVARIPVHDVVKVVTQNEAVL